jgi:hypothetical protein
VYICEETVFKSNPADVEIERSMHLSMKRAVLAYETGRMAVKYGLFHGSEWHRSENDADRAGHKPSNHSSGATSRLKAADIKYNKKK